MRYPPSSYKSSSDQILNSQQVAQEITRLIHETKPGGRVQKAQISLCDALSRRWNLYHQELLHCYDIPGLPQDNLKMERLFGCLRRHQRRISGRKSTRELQDLGQAQVLFTSQSFPELLDLIQRVPHATYQEYRHRLAEAELPRQFYSRLHRDPGTTIAYLIKAHLTRRSNLFHLVVNHSEMDG